MAKRRKKTTAKRKGGAKKTANRKRKVTRKKTTVRRKKATRKKATRKKATRKKATKKKVTRKKATRKKATKRKGGKRKASGLTKIKYKCSPALQAVIGTGAMTRPQIVKKLWAYIKAKKCQHATNRRMIVPDAKLAKIIGGRPVDMLKLATHLNKHILK